MTRSIKVETVAEFLCRGGEITKLPPVEEKETGYRAYVRSGWGSRWMQPWIGGALSHGCRRARSPGSDHMPSAWEQY